MRDHTSLVAWQQANAVVRVVLKAAKCHWRPWAATLFAQLQRSSLSVQLNITEGYGRKLAGPFRNHLEIAYGSALETADLLRLLAQEQIIPDEMARVALAHCTRTQRLIRGLLKQLGSRR